ncbi:MAG: DUF3147 family protein [Alphaproteobacteria bacterium]|nr:DUF3147 family protein [Alphaproteobacteria bacterium]
MLYMIFKAALSGIVIALVSEIARRSPGLGALVVSLPLISVLAMIWLWHEAGDSERIAAHAQATFWYVIPSLPMFLVLPALLRSGIGFYPALGLSCALTIALYFGMIWTLARFGIHL